MALFTRSPWPLSPSTLSRRSACSRPAVLIRPSLETVVRLIRKEGYLPLSHPGPPELDADFSRVEMRILMVGLDAAGKTTIL
jgi:hypothetical protein